jgi:hypothetical protein
VQHTSIVEGHEAGFVYLFGEEFDLEAGREVEGATREAFDGRWFEVEVDLGRKTHFAGGVLIVGPEWGQG